MKCEKCNKKILASYLNDDGSETCYNCSDYSKPDWEKTHEKVKGYVSAQKKARKL